jgi:Subtilase family
MIFPLEIRAAIAACALLFSPPAAAQLLGWRSATATSGTGDSSFVSVQNEEVDGLRKVYMAGNGSSNFLFGALDLLPLPARQSGIVVAGNREAQTGNVKPAWQSRAESSRSVVFTDLALIPDTRAMAVVGRFERDIVFKDGLLGAIGLPLGRVALSTDGGTHGFIAIIDRQTGTWKSAFVTAGLLPTSVSSDASNSVVVTGQGALAARYAVSNGQLVWKTTASAATSSQVHVAARPGSPVFVLGEESSAAEGVVLSALDSLTGTRLWTRHMGGPGNDAASGLAIDNFDRIHLAFQADHGQSTFSSVSIPVTDPLAGDTLFTAALSPEGTLEWAVPVSRPTGGGSITCADLAVDSTGGTWLACSVAGSWSFGGSAVTDYHQDAVALHVDAAGNAKSGFRANHDNADGVIRAISAAAPGEVFVAGDYIGTAAPVFGTLPALPAHPVRGAFMATLEIVSGQKLWVARPNPDAPSLLSLLGLRDLLELLGASVYAEVDADPGPKAISFWGTPGILAALLADPRIILTPESDLEPSGTISSPGWGLARLGGATSATAPYHYPDNTRPVRLYLIDTAVANPSNWIGANPKLKLEKSVLIRGSGDPVDSSQFKHGTQMLSLVGGMETGAAPGTPIRVVNYDIYPQGNTTTTTLLAKAVTEAVKDYRNSKNPLPSAICIATSSSTATTSYTLQSAIESALAEGIPVIVSAGNKGANAGNYIPSSYGSKAGVICIGAADNTDTILSSSNRGAAVDLLAPGKNLRTYGIDKQTRIETMTGTSPAAGLATALVLGELSAKGYRTPSQVERALLGYAKATSSLPLLRAAPLPTANPGSTPDPEPPTEENPPPAEEIQPPDEESPATPDGQVTDPANPVALGAEDSAFAAISHTTTSDSDADGIADVLEIFHGSDAQSAGSTTPGPSLTLSAPGEMQFSFPISHALFDASQPFTLKNGYAWRIRCSGEMKSWSVPAGSLAASTDAEGRLWLTD